MWLWMADSPGPPARADAACERFIVGVWLAGAGISAADGDVVHGSLAGGGDFLGEDGGERAKDDIDDALGCLDVAGGDCAGRTRIDQRALRRDDLNRGE